MQSRPLVASKATPTLPAVTSACKVYTPKPEGLVDHPKPLPKPRKPRLARPSKGQRQDLALYGAGASTRILRAFPGLTHGSYRVPAPLHAEITGEHADRTNIVWSTFEERYLEGAYTEVRWIEISIPVGIEISPNYRIKRIRPEGEPGPSRIVAFQATSNRQAKHFRKSHALPLVPSQASHGIAAVASYEATLSHPDTGRLGSWGIGSPTIKGKRLVREGDGGREHARGVLPSQWEGLCSASVQLADKPRTEVTHTGRVAPFDAPNGDWTPLPKQVASGGSARERRLAAKARK